MDDGAVVGAAKVTDVGAHQFIGAQPGQQRGQDQGAIALHPVGAPPRRRVGAERGQQGGHRIDPSLVVDKSAHIPFEAEAANLFFQLGVVPL